MLNASKDKINELHTLLSYYRSFREKIEAIAGLEDRGMNQKEKKKKENRKEKTKTRVIDGENEHFFTVPRDNSQW